MPFLIILSGILATVFYYESQIYFVKLEYITNPVHISIYKNKKWVGSSFKKTGITGTKTCRIRTKADSWTQLSIKNHGLILAIGESEFIIYPRKIKFIYVKKGNVVFLKNRKDLNRNAGLIQLVPFTFSVYANKKKVNQGKTIIFKVKPSKKIKKISGYFSYHRLMFVKDRTGDAYSSIQGMDVWEKKGKKLLAVKCYDENGNWMTRAYRIDLKRKRYSKRRRPPLYRWIAGKNKTKKRRRIIKKRRRRYSRSYRKWLSKWERKKRRIFSKNRPKKERKMLQKIYKKITLKRYWYRGFITPVKKYQRITSKFGIVRYLTYGGGTPHRGIDYGAKKNTPVRAAESGIVVFSGYTYVRGNLVIIDHGHGVYSSYFHLNELWIKKGSWVRRGQYIAAMGSTGLSTGPHLHFEVRAGNICVDPSEWLDRPVFINERWYKIVNL